MLLIDIENINSWCIFSFWVVFFRKCGEEFLQIGVFLFSMESHVVNDYDAPNLDGHNCGLLRDVTERASSLLLLFLF